MRSSYHADTRQTTYPCPGQNNRPGLGPRCQIVASRVVDELVRGQVLRALEPAALELSIQAQQDIERERRRLHENWRQRLERTRYDVERARRQYDTVEPENRLVARELERRWEDCLVEERTLREEYDRFEVEQPSGLSPDDRDRIRSDRK